jgi:elongation factor P
MATTNDLKNGMTLNLDGNLMNVVEFQHVKPGKGGAFVRTRLKNVRTGRTLDKTFRADEPVEVAILEKREMQYLYRDETGFVFMDTKTYDQSVVDADAVGGAASWLTDGATPYVTFYEGNAIGVELPAAVELAVAETEPGIKGDRVSGATKPATVETGAVVQVPLFVETGDRIKVDTRSGAYLTRVQ